MHLVRMGLLAVVFAMAVGCQAQQPEENDSPAAAYLSFARAAQKKPEAAFESLSAESQKRISAQAKSLSDASSGAIENDPAHIFFVGEGRAAPLNPPDVKVLKAEGDVALLTVKAAGKEQQVRMIKEQGRWRVDLLAVLP